jgi:hypothetical protein
MERFFLGFSRWAPPCLSCLRFAFKKPAPDEATYSRGTLAPQKLMASRRFFGFLGFYRIKAGLSVEPIVGKSEPEPKISGSFPFERKTRSF